MLKATVDNGPEQLWLQQEVTKARAVDGDIGALHILLGRGLSPISPSCCLHLIFFIVQELIVHIILCHNWAGRGRRGGVSGWVHAELSENKKSGGLSNSLKKKKKHLVCDRRAKS